MSDVKTTLTFAEFSDLCRGSIGYSHHMVALFDECDDVKHFRHPISFIEAVKRLKKTIKRLFERLETDNKKYVAEYEIGTYCWNSQVGKTINPMKPPTSPVVIKEQCDGMIIIACITDELIPKAIKENKREDLRMDPLMYAHGLTHALIQHFTFNSPDCRLRNKLYEHNMKKLSSVEAVGIYVTYTVRQESTDKLLNVEEEQGQNLFKMQLEEIGYQYCGSMQQDDGNSFFLACIDQLKSLGIEAVNSLELKQMVISQLKCLPEADYRDQFTRTDWLSYIDRLSKESKECIKDIVVRTTGCCLNQNIIVYNSATPNEPVKRYFPRIGSRTALVLAEENNYYIGLQKNPQWQERTGIKLAADSSPSTSTPTKKVHFKAERQEFANRETSMTTFTAENGKSTSTVKTLQISADSQVPSSILYYRQQFANRETSMTTFTAENGKSTSTVTTLQISADSQVPSVSSTLQETTVQIGSQPQREPATATDTTPTKQVTQQKGPKSEKRQRRK